MPNSASPDSGVSVFSNVAETAESTVSGVNSQERTVGISMPDYGAFSLGMAYKTAALKVYLNDVNVDRAPALGPSLSLAYVR